MSRFLPYVLFILSGACGLIYEVTWARYLALFLGNTTTAHMCVLAAYMGGLAVGSFLIGGIADRLRRPLSLYGWLEVAIGLYAMAFPFLVQPVQMLAVKAGAGLAIGSASWIVLKLAVSALVLLVPTVLMGGTYPILMRHCQPGSREQGDKAEWLYAANCGGAVAGALLAGFGLIPVLGMRGTLIDVGVANALLGAAAVVLGIVVSPHLKQTHSPQSAVQAELPSERLPRESRVTRAVYVAIAVSGTTSMIYELVWIRILAVTLGSSTYSFTLMVAAFITGIALGSLAVGLRPSLRANPLLGFAIAELGIAAAIIASIPLYERLPYYFWRMAEFISPSPATLWLHDMTKYSLCAAVMVVPTFFFGMTLPLAVKCVSRGDGRIGREAGTIYGANTLGTLAGALICGLLLIPVIGLRHSLEVALVANAACGALLLAASKLPIKRIIAGVAIAGAVAGVIVLPAWNPASFTRGTFRVHGTSPSSWQEYKAVRLNRRVVYYGEDSVGTVAVLSGVDTIHRRVDKALMIDGKGEASTYIDMPTQILVGQLPMLLKPDAREVLVVGLGSGVTAGSVLTHPNVRVDCVEISRAVGEAARSFDDVNNHVLGNLDFHLIQEDARTFVAASSKSYDMVISQPSNPWIAGIGNLFSIEYFESVAKTLKPGGVVVQWFHTYEINDELVRIILRTLRRVFPCAYVFQGSTNDYIVIGCREPLRPDLFALERRMRLPAVKADLARISVDSPAAVLSRQVLSPGSTARIAGSGTINTDDMPVLEYRAPKAQYLAEEAKLIARSDERLGGGADLLSADYLKDHPMDKAVCRSLVRMYSDPRMNDLNPRLRILRYYISRWPNDEWATKRYARLQPRRFNPALRR